MLKQRRQVAEAVAEALFAAETAIDLAIARTAQLTGLMPATRETARLSALVGQDAILGAIQTMRALGEARQGIVDTHRHLTVAQRQIGLSQVSFGAGVDKGLEGAEPTGRHLQPVPTPAGIEATAA